MSEPTTELPLIPTDAPAGPEAENSRAAAARARSNANLRPFRPGQSGNPRGRPPVGATIREWLNVMAEWPRERVTRVVDDPKAPAAKVIAAQRVLAACDAAGGSDFDRLCDRTEGKPRQTVELNQHAALTLRTPDDRDAAAAQAAERIRTLLGTPG